MVLAELDEVATCRNMEIGRAVNNYNREVARTGLQGLGAENDKAAMLARARANMQAMVDRGIKALGEAWRSKDLIGEPATKADRLMESHRKRSRRRGHHPMLGKM